MSEKATIKIGRSDLLDALESCAKLAGKNKAFPILANARVATCHESVTFEATTTETTIRKEKPAQWSNPCDFLIDCAAALKYVKLIKSQNITITVEGQSAVIKHDDGNLRIPIIEGSKFPETHLKASTEAVSHATFDNAMLVESIEDGMSFVGTDSFHPNMMSLRIFAKDGVQGYSASDSRKLVNCELPYEASANCEMLVSQQAMPLLASCADESPLIMAFEYEKSIVFKFDKSIVAQTKVAARYPDVKRVIPTKFDVVLNCDRDTLASAVKRISASTSADCVMKMSVNPDTISLSSIEEGAEKSATETLGCNAGGEYVIGLSPVHLLDVLSAFPAGDIALSYCGSSRPIVATSQAKPGKLALLMPMTV